MHEWRFIGWIFWLISHIVSSTISSLTLRLAKPTLFGSSGIKIASMNLRANTEFCRVQYNLGLTYQTKHIYNKGYSNTNQAVLSIHHSDGLVQKKCANFYSLAPLKCSCNLKIVNFKLLSKITWTFLKKLFPGKSCKTSLMINQHWLK